MGTPSVTAKTFASTTELKCSQSETALQRWLLSATVAQVSVPKSAAHLWGSPAMCTCTTLCCGLLGQPFVRAPVCAWRVSQFLPLTTFNCVKLYLPIVRYTDTCSMPIIMYCLGPFVVVYSKQHCSQTKKYDVAHVVMDMYIPIHGFISFGF